MQIRFLTFILAAVLSVGVQAQMFGAQVGISAGLGGYGGTPWGMGGYGAQYCPYDMTQADGATAESDQLLRAIRGLKKAEADKKKKEAKLDKLKAQLKKSEKGIRDVLTVNAAQMTLRHMDTGKSRSDSDYTQGCGQGASAGTSGQPTVMPPSHQTPADPNRSIPTSSAAKVSDRKPAAANEFYCLQTGKNDLGHPIYTNLWEKYAGDNGAVDGSICYESNNQITKNANSDKRSDCQEAINEYLSLKGEIDEAKADIKTINAQIKDLEKLADAEKDRLESMDESTEADCRECRIFRRNRAKPSTLEVIGNTFGALAGAGLAAWGIHEGIKYNAKAGYPTNPLQVALPGFALLTQGVYGAINGGMSSGAYGCAGGGQYGNMMGGNMGGVFGYPSNMMPMMSGGAMMPGAFNMMGSPYGNMMGSPYGNMMGSPYGNMMGSPYGNMMGSPYGNMMGSPYGNMMGSPYGNMMGSPYGNMMSPYGMMSPNVLPMMGNNMMGSPYGNMMGNMMNPYGYNPMMGGNSLGSMQMQMQMAQMQMQQMQQQQQYVQQVYQQQMYKQSAVASIQQQIYALQMQMYQISSSGGPSILPYGNYGGGGYGSMMGGYGAYGALGAGITGYGSGPQVLPYPSPYGR